MTDAAQLRLVEEPEAGSETAEEPKVFAKSIAVPPGAPWDQARAARLEARNGAPLSLAEVTHQVRRLDPWRPGRPAKFVAFYVRAKDVGLRLKTQVLVDERWLEVVFVSRAERERQARQSLLTIVASTVGILVVLISVAVAITARQGAEVELANLEQLAAAKTKLATAVEEQRREASALEAAGVRHRALSTYLGDLDWAASAKAPGARIQAVHWDHGTLAVEARGDTAPFVAAGREVTKVDKPLSPGLWLWGVADHAAAADQSANVGGAP